MATFKHNLRIDQGATFREVITWNTGTPPELVDLTGATARAQIRSTLGSSSVLLSLTTENSKIVLGDEDGTITLALSATETAALTWTTGVYDLEIVFADGTVRRLMAGKVKVVAEVTR